MTQKLPHSPFTTRLSGSAKETELRLRNIFQWKKKRPPIILFILTAVLVLSCCGLVSCQVEPAKQTDDPDVTSTPSDEVLESNATAPWTGHPFSCEAFFAAYVADFPEYTYTGAHSANILGRTIELEDTPENFAEEMVWNNYWLPFVGNYEPYTALMGSYHMRISAENTSKNSFQTVTIHSLSVLTEQDYQPASFYFSEQTTAERFMTEVWHDVWTYGLTEYTVAYVDLSWEWTPEHLALGPQLGNGRYERLYLLGKTKADPNWKMYNIYWGEYDLNRITEETEPAANVWQGGSVEFMELTILLPENWKGKVEYERGHEWISFYHLPTRNIEGYESAGGLFTVSWSLGPLPLDYLFPYPGEVLATTSDASYTLTVPSDVQFTPQTQEEYLSLNPSDVQFVFSDWLLENSLNKNNPNNPNLAPVYRDGHTMALTEDAVMTGCYSYTYLDPEDTYSYWWFETENHELKKGDIVLLLEEADGRSRVVIPYGDVPWLYGFVDSGLLSAEQTAFAQANQAILAETTGYYAPNGAVSSTSEGGIVVIRAKQDNWVKVEPHAGGAESYWVENPTFSYDFDQSVIDAPTALNFIP